MIPFVGGHASANRLDVSDLVRAEPFRLHHDGGVAILTRGTTSIRIAGELAQAVADVVLSAVERPVTVEEILARFDAGDHEDIRDFLDHLAAKRLLVRDDDDGARGPRAIFYWDFGLNEREVLARARTVRIAVVGDNALARATFSQLDRGGLEGARLVASVDADEPQLVVGTSDAGGQAALLEMNRHCIGAGIHFLPVVLESTRGTIGPWVVPHETPCLQCARMRQNANLDDYESVRAGEAAAFYGSHPALAEIVGALAGWEIIKRFTQLPGWKPGLCLTYRALDGALKSHRILRAARCPHCSAVNRHAPVNVEEYSFTGSQTRSGRRGR